MDLISGNVHIISNCVEMNEFNVCIVGQQSGDQNGEMAWLQYKLSLVENCYLLKVSL